MMQAVIVEKVKQPSVSSPLNNNNNNSSSSSSSSNNNNNNNTEQYAVAAKVHFEQMIFYHIGLVVTMTCDDISTSSKLFIFLPSRIKFTLGEFSTRFLGIMSPKVLI